MSIQPLLQVYCLAVERWQSPEPVTRLTNICDHYYLQDTAYRKIWTLLLVVATNTASSSSTMCLKNDTDVASYNFDADQPILIIFGR